eukprot:gene12146-biopygen391
MGGEVRPQYTAIPTSPQADVHQEAGSNDNVAVPIGRGMRTVTIPKQTPSGEDEEFAPHHSAPPPPSGLVGRVGRGGAG